MGADSCTPSATETTKPSVAMAALSEIMASVDAVCRRSPAAGLASFSRTSRSVLTLTPAGALSDNSGAKTPSTSTSLLAPVTATGFSAALARFNAAASGFAESGRTSRIRARRSVYFHSSIRRCGSPARSKASKASRLVGDLARTGQAIARRGEQALHRGSRSQSLPTQRSSQNPLPSGFLELRVAGFLQLQRELLAAAFDDTALRHHMHIVGHDVVQ